MTHHIKKIKIRLHPWKKKNGETVFIPMQDEFTIEIKDPIPTGGGIAIEVDASHFTIEAVWDEDH